MRGGKNRLGGFTIVELLLATAIFSTVLMVVIAGFLQIGRLFYKGVTLTNTQQVARTVIDNVSNDVRYNNSVSLHQSDFVTDNDVGYYCIGNTRYTFHLHHAVPATDNYGGVTNATDFGLLRDTLSGSTGCADPYASLTRFNPETVKEMLSPNMRLNDFSVASFSGGQVYDISVDIVTGDDASLTPDTNDPNIKICASNLKNTQYCAQAKLSTSVSVNTGALNVSNVRKNGVIVKKGGKGHADIKSTINASDNPGVDITGYDNVLCGGTCQVVYPQIVTIVLDVVTPIKDPYSQFNKWTFAKGDQGCIRTPSIPANKNPNNYTPCKLKVEGGVYITAVFKCTNPSGSCDYTLNVSKAGDGSGSIASNKDINCGSNCSQTFDTVSDVVLTAAPNSNSSFKNWNYNCKGSGESKNTPQCTVHVDQVQNVTAKFKCNVAACSWDISVAPTGKGGGTIQSTPDPSTNTRKIDCGGVCSASFDSATTISLTAIPNDSSTFAGWSSQCADGSKTSNPCVVNVNDSITFNAKFNKK